MTRYAVITIEAPLDGGTEEDAKVLGQFIASQALTIDPDADTSLHPDRVYGQVIDAYIEDRRDGAMGHTRAQAILRTVDWEEES